MLYRYCNLLQSFWFLNLKWTTAIRIFQLVPRHFLIHKNIRHKKLFMHQKCICMLSSHEIWYWITQQALCPQQAQQREEQLINACKNAMPKKSINKQKKYSRLEASSGASRYSSCDNICALLSGLISVWTGFIPAWINNSSCFRYLPALCSGILVDLLAEEVSCRTIVAEIFSRSASEGAKRWREGDLLGISDESAADLGRSGPHHLGQVAGPSARLEGQIAGLEVVFERRQLTMEPQVDGAAGPVLGRCQVPAGGGVLTDPEARHVTTLVVGARGALVDPSLRHRGQLVVPGQVGHRLGGRQAVVGVHAVLHVLSNRVVGAEDLCLLGGTDAALQPSLGAGGGGGVTGVQTHGVLRAGAGGDGAVVGVGHRGGHRRRQHEWWYHDGQHPQ